MNCPDDYTKLKVKHTRPGYLGHTVSRVYECPKCGQRWGTREIFAKKIDWNRNAMYIAPITYGKTRGEAGINRPGAIVINSAGNHIPTPRIAPDGSILKKKSAKRTKRSPFSCSPKKIVTPVIPNKGNNIESD